MCGNTAPATVKLLLFVSALRDGGAERSVAALANAFARRGHSVDVVTLLGEEPEDYALDPGVRRTSLDLLSHSRGLADAVVQNARRGRALRRVVRDTAPDAMVAFMTSSNVLALLATVGLGVPVIVSERIHPPHVDVAAHWRRLRPASYRLAWSVVALTGQSADWLRRHTSARRVDIIPNSVAWPPADWGANAEDARWIVAPPPAGNGPMLVAAGRLDGDQKDYPTLLRAFAHASRAAPDWMLSVLGSGNPAPLERLADELGVGERVRFVGQVGNVADWYRRADVYAMSSRFEGFPNALAEAMAAGLAVVSTDCPTGPAELIEHGRDGLLVPVGDVDALADALGRLFADAALRAGLGEAARDVTRRFGTEAVLERWLTVLGEAVEGRDVPHPT